MKPSELRAIGVALHGRWFLFPLGAALGVNERTLRRWLAGSHEIPEGVPRQLAEIANKRIAELEKEHKASVKHLRALADKLGDTGV